MFDVQSVMACLLYIFSGLSLILGGFFSFLILA